MKLILSKDRYFHPDGHVFQKLLVALALLTLLIVVAAAALVGYGWWRWSSVPAYWQANNQYQHSVSKQQLVQIADRSFNRWVSEFTAPIAGDPVDHATGTNPGLSSQPATGPKRGQRHVHISLRGLNAWLDTRLIDWLNNQGINMPRQISDPMAFIYNGKPAVAFNVNIKGVSQVVSLVFNPQFKSKGTVSLQLVLVRGGTLPLPVESLVGILDRLLANSDGPINKIVQILKGRPFDPVIVLDSRQARITGFKAVAKGFDVTIRHQPVGR